MKTITNNTEAEIVEKRSKFISNLYYVETVEQAENKLKEIKKKYNDARHNCFAYRVCEKNTVVERASDDGEPTGTAGAPMLNILSDARAFSGLKPSSIIHHSSCLRYGFICLFFNFQRY